MSFCVLLFVLNNSFELKLGNLQQHRDGVFHVFAEVLQPAGTDGSVDCSVIGADGHRDESAFLESRTRTRVSKDGHSTRKVAFLTLSKHSRR